MSAGQARGSMHAKYFPALDQSNTYSGFLLPVRIWAAWMRVPSPKTFRDPLQPPQSICSRDPNSSADKVRDTTRSAHSPLPPTPCISSHQAFPPRTPGARTHKRTKPPLPTMPENCPLVRVIFIFSNKKSDTDKRKPDDLRPYGLSPTTRRPLMLRNPRRFPMRLAETSSALRKPGMVSSSVSYSNACWQG